MGGSLAKSSICPIGLKPEHAVYLHISVQYIKYSLVFFFIQKILFFFLFSFFQIPRSGKKPDCIEPND